MRKLADAPTIEINIDRYGIAGRVGALADFWEVAALGRVAITQSDIGDAIKDRDWTNLETNRVLGAGETAESRVRLPDAQDRAMEMAARVAASIQERSDVLGPLYPFRLTDGGTLRLKPRFVRRKSAYLALLAAAVLHSWSVPTSLRVEMIFERFVVGALSGHGLQAAGMGTATAGTFSARLREIADRLGLRADETRASRSVSAQDEGVDFVATLIWQDNRAGQWIWIGQATCAASDRWAEKLNEPSSTQWAQFLLEVVPPQPFLALPHHLEPKEFELLLIKGRSATVLDRLRLTSSAPRLTKEQVALVDALLTVEVDPIN